MEFSELGLNESLLGAIVEAGYPNPTAVQEKAVPAALAGRDLMVSSQTGSGTTAAVMWPALKDSDVKARGPRILVLTPTRELAIQVTDACRKYGRGLRYAKAVSVVGGTSYVMQNKLLAQPYEVLVATPGRLIDQMDSGRIDFGRLEMLVLDEADRMLDMGFIPDIKRILALLPAQRQSLLFSATFSEEIKKLAQAMLRDPQLIEVARRNATAETITHRVHACGTDDKRALLTHLLTQDSYADRQALVFVNTKFGASRLAHHLVRQGVAADAIHGDKSQQQRTEALEAFKNGSVRVLVATDVAARGLDIEDLPFVINFELPHNAEDYVHRIGRTGRAGRSGEAISLAAPEEKGRVADIEKLIRKPIEIVVPEGFDPARARTRETRSERPERAARSERGERGERRSRPSASDAPRAPRAPRASASTVAADGFDFSKPYESSTPDVPADSGDGSVTTTPSSPHPSDRRRR